MNGVIDHHDGAETAGAETRDDFQRKEPVVGVGLVLVRSGGIVKSLQDIAALAHMTCRAAAHLHDIFSRIVRTAD